MFSQKLYFHNPANVKGINCQYTLYTLLYTYPLSLLVADISDNFQGFWKLF